MLEDEMYIKDVKIPDIEKIVELKPLEHVNAGNSNTIIPVPLPKPPLFNGDTTGLFFESVFKFTCSIVSL